MIPRALALALMLLATPALAQPAQAQPAPAQPRTQPTRDVIVTYRVDGQATSLIPGGIPGPLKLFWDAAGRRLRAEAEGRTQVALIDLKNQGGQAIDTTLHVVLPLPIKTSDLQPLTLEGARLTKRGPDRVAGLACTNYAVEGHSPGTVCLTQDGVPLRGQGDISGKPGTFTATAVQYGRLSSDLFEVPRGYISLGGAASGLAGLAGAAGAGGAAGGASGASGLAGKLGALGINPSDLRNLFGRGSK